MPGDVLSSLLGIVAAAGSGYNEAKTTKENQAIKAKELASEQANKLAIAGTEAKSRTDVAKIGAASSLNEKLLSLQADRENLATQLANDHEKWASANGIERDRIAETIRNNTGQLKALNAQIALESRKVDIEQQKANTEQAYELGTGPGSKGSKAGKSPQDILQGNVTKLIGDYLSGGGDPTKVGEFVTKTLSDPTIRPIYGLGAPPSPTPNPTPAIPTTIQQPSAGGDPFTVMENFGSGISHNAETNTSGIEGLLTNLFGNQPGGGIYAPPPIATNIPKTKKIKTLAP